MTTLHSSQQHAYLVYMAVLYTDQLLSSCYGSYLANGRHGVQRGSFCPALQSLLYGLYGNGHSCSSAQLSHYVGSILHPTTVRQVMRIQRVQLKRQTWAASSMQRAWAIHAVWLQHAMASIDQTRERPGYLS